MRAGEVPAAHWGFLSEPYPKPETEIGRDPLPYFEGLMAKWSQVGNLSFLDPRALQSYRQSCNEPSRIHAFCEDYRAGATCDVAQDEADLAAGRQIACPVLVISGDQYLSTGENQAVDIWKRWASNVRGTVVQSGHFVMEEKPREVLAALVPFLQGQ